jgi:hypothetical protein
LPLPPILENKDPKSPSVFLPSALVREARRQKGLPVIDVPEICMLDPDGDIVRRLKAEGRAKRFDSWPCYHTDLYTFSLGGETVGILGCVVGAPFAVLIAEELFACGCRILISLTSAGQIVALENPPYFVIIDRALRDEGASLRSARSICGSRSSHREASLGRAEKGRAAGGCGSKLDNRCAFPRDGSRR